MQKHVERNTHLFVEVHPARTSSATNSLGSSFLSPLPSEVTSIIGEDLIRLRDDPDLKGRNRQTQAFRMDQRLYATCLCGVIFNERQWKIVHRLPLEADLEENNT